MALLVVVALATLVGLAVRRSAEPPRRGEIAGTGSREDGGLEVPGSLGSRRRPRGAAQGPPGDPSAAGRPRDRGVARDVLVTVLDDASGEPIPDARVWPKVPRPEGEDLSLSDEWTTGADGRVRIDEVPGDSLLVLVRAKGHLTTGWVEVPPGRADLTVRLAPGWSLAGRVTGPSGEAVPEVRLLATAVYGVHVERVEAEPDGTFRFDTLPPGRTRVFAHGRVGDRDLVGRAEAEAGAEGVEIRLDSPPLVRARIVGPDGAPVPHATVEWRLGTSWGDEEADGGRVVLRGFPSPRPCILDVYGARSDDQEPLPFGPAHLDRVVPNGEEILIRLPPERAISGVARDAAGNPAGGVQVVAVTPDETGDPGAVSPAAAWTVGRVLGQEHGSATSDASGAFRIGGLGARPYDVFAQARGDWIGSDPLRVPSGASDVAIVIRRGVTVTVRVEDADGRPLPLARVGAEAMHGRTMVELEDERAPHELALAHRGSARIGPVDPTSPLVLWVLPPREREDLARRVVAPWAPEETTVRLERARVVTGTVRDPEGRPVPRARVEWRSANRPWLSASAREDGRFALRGVPLAPVAVRARHRPPPAWGTAEDDPLATGPVGREVLFEPWRDDVTVVVDAGAALTVRLPPSFGGSSTIWLLLRQDGRLVPIATEWIGDGSEWVFRGLDPSSTYAVFASTMEEPGVAWRTDLRPGAEPVLLDRVRAGAIHVRVKAPPGAAEPDVRASMHGLPRLARRSPDGGWVIEHLLEGTWPVTASADVGGVPWTAAAEAPAGGSIELELTRTGR